MSKEKLENLKEKVENDELRITSKDGGYFGTNWYELTGEGVEELKQLINSKEISENTFNKALGPAFEERWEKQREKAQKEFEEFLENNKGEVFYGPEELAKEPWELDSELAQKSKKHQKLSGHRAFYKILLRDYRGDGIEVFVDPEYKVTTPSKSSVFSQYPIETHHPKGVKIKLQQQK